MLGCSLQKKSCCRWVLGKACYSISLIYFLNFSIFQILLFLLLIYLPSSLTWPDLFLPSLNFFHSHCTFSASRDLLRLALLKNKKNSSFTSLFPLRSTEISRKWKHSEKYNKTDRWKFLVIFPKRSTEISSLSKF